MEKKNEYKYNKEFDDYAVGQAAITAASLAIGGIGKGVSAILNGVGQRKYNEAKKEFDISLNIYNESREKTKQTILKVVLMKKDIMQKYMTKFVKSYRRLNPQIEIRESLGIGELRKFSIDQKDVTEIENLSLAYKTYNQYKLGDKAANTALLMVQDGRVSELTNCMRDVIRAGKMNDAELKKIKMDDLKIKSIGVLAEFSTIGIEFGFSGVSDAFASARNLQRSKVAVAELQKNKEILDTKVVIFNAIEQKAQEHLKLLNEFIPLMDEYVLQVAEIIRKKDNFLHLGRIKGSKFSEQEISMMAFTSSLVGAVKAIIDIPIISKDGGVSEAGNKKLQEMQGVIKNYKIGCNG